MSSEYEYGTLIAEDLYREMQDRNMSVCGHRLIGQLCREGFVERLADLFGVRTDGVVDTPTVPKVDGRTVLVSVPQNLPQGGVEAVGISMRGHS